MALQLNHLIQVNFVPWLKIPAVLNHGYKLDVLSLID